VFVVECEVTPETGIAKQVTRTITELKALQEPILAGEVAPDVLEEFRDASNRVRNSAWAAQQSAAGPLLENGASSVASFLAAERIRVAYQLCRAIQEDVRRDDVELQKGSVAELYAVAQSLVEELKEWL
jgi:hypothetical protein